MIVWKGYQKGINLGGWLSQCVHTKEHYENFIKKEDIERIASWGLDHVRVPVDYNLVEKENGEYMEEGFAYIQRIIDWCREYHLNMVLDLHKTAGYSFDPGEKEDGFFDNKKNQERFYCLWEEFAKRYAQNDFVAFELLNEVTLPSYMPSWNAICKVCIKRIRAIAPTTDILVGGYWNNSVQSVSSIDVDLDEHIIYNFHCYDPLIFTHQSAPWVEGMPLDYHISFDESYEIYEKQYTELGFDKFFGEFPKMENPKLHFEETYFEKNFANAIAYADQKKVALYCGEYGVIDLADAREALKWYHCILKVLKKYGIGCAAWSYRGMNYGFVDEHFAPVLNDVLCEITQE